MGEASPSDPSRQKPDPERPCRKREGCEASFDVNDEIMRACARVRAMRENLESSFTSFTLSEGSFQSWLEREGTDASSFTFLHLASRRCSYKATWLRSHHPAASKVLPRLGGVIATRPQRHKAALPVRLAAQRPSQATASTRLRSFVATRPPSHSALSPPPHGAPDCLSLPCREVAL